jgi:hypothetical protein
MAVISIRIERAAKPERTPAQRRRRMTGVAAVTGAAALVAATLVDTSAHAAGTVSITPKVIKSGAAVAANKSLSVAVSGGTTTVPSNATRVVMAVTVAKAQQAGVLGAYPAGNPAGSSGDSLSFAPTVSQTATFTEQVGLSNKVTFVNQSAGSISLTVKITGYSTDVRASDVSGIGGTAGQVLTNTGAGAHWAAAGGPAFASTPPQFTNISLSGSPTTVAAITVPAGTYQVSATGTLTQYGGPATYINCALRSPAGTQVTDTYTTLVPGALGALVPFSLTGLVHTSAGGVMAVRCFDFNGGTSAAAYDVSIVATQVSSGSGSVTPNVRVAPRLPRSANRPTR